METWKKRRGSVCFLLDSAGQIKEFTERGFRGITAYRTDEVKDRLRGGYREFVNYAEVHKLSGTGVDDALEYIWSEFLSGKVPDWAEWKFMPRYIDPASLEAELEKMPDGKYVTSGIGRDRLLEAFGPVLMPVAEGIRIFSKEL